MVREGYFMFDLPIILTGLAKVRPLFHSEADFQHALAWRIHELHPELSVRLECRPIHSESLYLDLWVRGTDSQLAIELKYAKREIETTIDGETYVLKNQAAQDIKRYDFVKDISRLERIVRAYPTASGYAVLLTNDSSYWTLSARESSIDAAFRIHEGAILTGRLEWASNATVGTTKNRKIPHTLSGVYTLSWNDYSLIPGHPVSGRFRYLLVRVKS